MTRHSDRAGRALLHLADADPALAMLGLWCRHRDDPGPTRTRGDTVLYGPECDALPLPEAVGLTAHHILHVALRHSARSTTLAERLGERYDRALHVLCLDAVINETLQAAGHALPRPAVTLTGLLAAALEPASSPFAALAEWDSERLYFALIASPQARGKAQEHGQRQGFRADLEPSRDGPGASDEDWRGHLLRALAAGRAAGSGIGALPVILKEAQPSRIAWEHQLRRLLARALSAEPRLSHSRPARRWVAMEAEARVSGGLLPAFQPALRRDRRRLSLLLALDLSSSIDDTRLGLFAAEVEAICARSGAEVTLLPFDTAVQAALPLRPGQVRSALAAPQLKRGGGTDFAPVMEHASRARPSAVVLLTDLDGPTGANPGCPVIWCCPTAPASPPPFGRVITLDP